jgi:hypothetical protein
VAPGATTGTNTTRSQNNAVTGEGFNANFNGVSQTPFFTDTGARRQLNLNDNQFNSLNSSYQNAYSRYNQAVRQLSPNLTPQQREQHLQQLQAQFNQNLSGTVNSTLTDPQTRSRFDQLNRQYMGFNAFNDPTIRRQLNLTPQQVRQLRTLSNNWRQQLQQFRQGAGNDLGSVDQGQWAQMQQQAMAQLNGVLTPEQQQMWSQQTGQPFSFSPNVYFGTGETANGVNNRTDATDTNISPRNGPVQQPAPPGTPIPHGRRTGPVQQPGASGTPVPNQTAPGQPAAAQPAAQGGSASGTATQSGSQGTVR